MRIGNDITGELLGRHAEGNRDHPQERDEHGQRAEDEKGIGKDVENDFVSDLDMTGSYSYTT